MASGIVRIGIPRNRKALLSITESANKRLKEMLQTRPNMDKPCVGFRLGVKQRGCTGESYQLDYTDHTNKFDEVVQADGVSIIIDPKALLSVIGSEMDYVEDKLRSEFVFTNPNATHICGCGESFTTTNK
eukprot:TRINITY_DN1408_c0_g1_i1.p1 TRINITY_DN1408_c0_g1~~TRINITY_DN1408_c0_g1_i1.p1  ORF type:complete len:130 (-),score=19.67 TRINITY_DN1408_c0_g1_i1:118-507(-)